MIFLALDVPKETPLSKKEVKKSNYNGQMVIDLIKTNCNDIYIGTLFAFSSRTDNSLKVDIVALFSLKPNNIIIQLISRISSA